MKKIISVVLLISCVITAQTFKAEKIKGNVKVQIGSNEDWTNVKDGMILNSNSVISTEKNSSVQLSGNNINFVLKETSALPLYSLKKMTMDELLLALAMEDMINAPMKKEDDNSQNTAVYGSEENGKSVSSVTPSNFGIRKLNGALQLAENGFKESAIINAKETFRKYPETKNIIFYRICFADLLIDKGLYEEAYADFKSIDLLKMSVKEKNEVQNTLNILSKKLIKN